VLASLPLISDPNLIIGLERAEDAGVYRLSDEMALIQTVDFFTPIVDDPYQFGQIAAANALSDVYAKGGRPLTALNIVCFPVKTFDLAVLKETLLGGLDKLREAGVLLVGGHSIDDPEMKYGLAVTGTIHPQKVVLNNSARPGDQLILTKAIGTGIISTAIKQGAASREAITLAVNSMAALNKQAGELMVATGVSAATDITGFGLLGHTAEMIENTGMGMVIRAAEVPILPQAKELAQEGFIPGGLRRNQEYRRNMVSFGAGVPEYLKDLLFDPQTSGGLLIALAPEKAAALLKNLREGGIREAAIIGEVVGAHAGQISVE
jgi:selenide,water dikinase